MPRLLPFLAILTALAACTDRAPSTADCRLDQGGTILAIGDSITRGFGAPGNGYPEQLQALLARAGRSDVVVVNRGVDGERSDGLLARIDDELDRHRPGVVVITSGGNDFLRRHDADTESRLGTIIDRVRAAGAFPVIFAVPKPGLGAAFGSLSDHPVYETLADRRRVTVIDDVVSDVLSSQALKADAIHPNEQGYARMAEAVARALETCL
jgi:acyl-CoA thioesterase-1